MNFEHTSGHIKFLNIYYRNTMQQAYELLVKNISTDKLELLRVIIGKELNERIIASNVGISRGTMNGKDCMIVILPKFVDIAPVFDEYGKCTIQYTSTEDNSVTAFVLYKEPKNLLNALSIGFVIKEAIQDLLLSC